MADDSFDDGWPDDDGPSETIECSACGADIYEEAEQCPLCGEFIVRDTRALTGRPNWYVALAVLGIIAVIIALLRYF